MSTPSSLPSHPATPPGHVVIVGGGVMGSSIAWHLAQRHGVRVTVLERDPSYARASSALSVCAIRQQFSTAINVQLSQQSLLFYRNMAREFAALSHVPALGLVEPGYLYLAATESGAEELRRQQRLQRELGVHTMHLTPAALGERFPWLEHADLRLGSLGLSTTTSGEGWFDGYAALQAFRTAAIASGATYLEDEAVGVTVEHAGRVDGVRTARHDTVPCDALVIAAGAWSARVAEWVGHELPVRARKRDVFAFETDADISDAPLVIDPSGVWFRPDAQPGRFLCGAPPRGGDADDLPLERVDHGLFDDVIWPALAARVPAFDALRVTACWAGYYEMNTFDQNGIVGPLHGLPNVYAACGFSGHGLQQAPAVGRALAEHIATGAYHSLDLSPLGAERIVRGERLLERNVI